MQTMAPGRRMCRRWTLRSISWNEVSPFVRIVNDPKTIAELKTREQRRKAELSRSERPEGLPPATNPGPIC